MGRIYQRAVRRDNKFKIQFKPLRRLVIRLGKRSNKK